MKYSKELKEACQELSTNLDDWIEMKDGPMIIKQLQKIKTTIMKFEVENMR